MGVPVYTEFMSCKPEAILNSNSLLGQTTAKSIFFWSQHANANRKRGISLLNSMEIKACTVVWT